MASSNSGGGSGYHDNNGNDRSQGQNGIHHQDHDQDQTRYQTRDRDLATLVYLQGTHQQGHEYEALAPLGQQTAQFPDMTATRMNEAYLESQHFMAPTFPYQYTELDEGLLAGNATESHGPPAPHNRRSESMGNDAFFGFSLAPAIQPCLIDADHSNMALPTPPYGQSAAHQNSSTSVESKAASLYERLSLVSPRALRSRANSVANSPFMAPQITKTSETSKCGKSQQGTRGRRNWKTTLHLAAENGHVKVVQMLLEKQVNVYCQDKIGRTALHLAALNGHESVVGSLVAKHDNLDVKDHCGSTALHIACDHGHTGVVRKLVENQASLHVQNSSGLSPLHLAAAGGCESVVQLLLDMRIDGHVKDHSGRTPLHHAADKGHKAIVKTLLEMGADIDTQDMSGQTALHVATEKGQEDVVRTLLVANANVDTQDRAGLTALHLACCNGQDGVATLLLNKGADFNMRAEL